MKKREKKSKGTFVMSILKVDYLVAIFFQVSYLLNWDLPQILFGQKFPKSAIVRLAMSTRSSVSWLDSSKTSLLQTLFLKSESKAIENKNQILKIKGLLEIWFLVTSQLFCFVVIIEWAAWPWSVWSSPLTIFPTHSTHFPAQSHYCSPIALRGAESWELILLLTKVLKSWVRSISPH